MRAISKCFILLLFYLKTDSAEILYSWKKREKLYENVLGGTDVFSLLWVSAVMKGKGADSEGDSFSKKIVFIIVTFGKSALSSLPTFAGFGGRLI